MNIVRSVSRQRGVSAWAVAGILFVVAGAVGLGVAWTGTGSTSSSMATATTASTSPQQSGVGLPPSSTASRVQQQAKLPGSLSSAAFGDAKFGMRADAVERALGKRLILNDEQRAAGIGGLKCGSVSVDGLPGVALHFNDWRLGAASLNKDAKVTTQSGLAIGDPESKVIAALQGDPTYRRDVTRHADPSDKNAPTEITVGRSRVDPKTNRVIGAVVQFYSEGGRVSSISAGDAGYVLDDEHIEECW